MCGQNFIKMSAAGHELSCPQRKKTQTKTIQSVATVRTVIKTVHTDVHKMSVTFAKSEAWAMTH